METYGFVYIWRDRKHNRYYIGSHWGLETDKYICSSNWMRHSYKRRPQDFKRRILQYIYTNRNDLYKAEQYWMDFIKEDELKIKYYNITNKAGSHWTAKDPVYVDGIKQKITNALVELYNNNPEWSEKQRKLVSQTLKNLYDNDPEWSAKRKAHMSEIGKMGYGKEFRFEKGQEPWNKGTKGLTVGWNKGLTGEDNPLYGIPRLEETKAKISKALKGKPGSMLGKHHTEESKRKSSESNKGQKRSGEALQHMREARKGYRWWTDGINNKSARECPGEGWYIGRTGSKTNSKMSEAKMGVRCWTNGIDNKRSKECPNEGYYIGRTSSKTKQILELN